MSALGALSRSVPSSSVTLADVYHVPGTLEKILPFLDYSSPGGPHTAGTEET